MKKEKFSEQGFLGCLKDQRIPCVIITSNGFQMQDATVLAIDSDKNALLVEYSGARQMVYQHSVSTIRPLRPVRLETVDWEGGGTDG